MVPLSLGDDNVRYDRLMRLTSTVVVFAFVATAAFAQTPPPTAPVKPTTPPVQAPKRAASPTSSTTTLSITVTDGRGAPIGNVAVVVSGPVAREGQTDANGSLRLQGLRSGTYRLRFSRDEYITLERDVSIPARQASMDHNVMLSAAPARAPEPAAPPPPAQTAPAMPPPGKPVTMSVPDFIEKNFIAANAPQKTSAISCSGLVSSALWQIREPWDRQHASSDAVLYVIGGEGSLKLDGREVPLQAGSFALVPRGSAYELSRRGRNPLILVATLAGEACTP